MSGGQGSTQPSGALGLQVIRPLPMRPLKLREMVHHGLLPLPGQSAEVRRFKRRNAPAYLRGFFKVALARITSMPVVYGSLAINVIRADGTVVPYGLVGHRVVTTAGVTKIVDFLRANDTTTGTNFKFHGIGTGSTAEASGDTTLVTELTTEYSPDNTRPTGSQTNNGATVYRTVGTVTVDATPGAAIREHGVFSASSAGTLLDRTVFAAITLSSGDSIQATYDLTCAAGG
jgi:hypothetical protein